MMKQETAVFQQENIIPPIIIIDTSKANQVVKKIDQSADVLNTDTVRRTSTTERTLLI